MKLREILNPRDYIIITRAILVNGDYFESLFVVAFRR